MDSEVKKIKENAEKLDEGQSTDGQDLERSRMLQKAMEETTGLKDSDAATSIICQTLLAVYGDEIDSQGLNIIFGILQATKPEDPLEAMLINEMFTLHSKGMQCFKKSKEQFRGELSEKYELQGMRLFKGYASLLRALSKYRTDRINNL